MSNAADRSNERRPKKQLLSLAILASTGVKDGFGRIRVVKA